MMNKTKTGMLKWVCDRPQTKPARAGDNQLDICTLKSIITMPLEAPTTDLDLEEILNLDTAAMEQIVVEFWRKKPEELVKLEEEVKKQTPQWL